LMDVERARTLAQAAVTEHFYHRFVVGVIEERGEWWGIA
jgi:hypothetical protein